MSDREDAERYRWIRDHMEGVHIEPGATGSGIYSWCLQVVEPIPVSSPGDLLSTEIDKAIDDCRR